MSDEAVKKQLVTDDERQAVADDESVVWEEADDALPPAKRPSTSMRRCDGRSGVE
jgi:hypothetical protein